MRNFIMIFCFFQFQNFVLSQNRNVDRNILDSIVQLKKYDLVGDFFVVQKNPEIKYAKVYRLHKGWGYIDNSGNEAIETKYHHLSDFYNGICKAQFTAQRKHPQTGMMRYSDVQEFKGFVFGIQQENYYLINLNTGNHLSTEQNMSFSGDTGYSRKIDHTIIMQKDGGEILLNDKGKVVARAKKIEVLSSNYLTFRNSDNKVGVINKKGKILIHPQYLSLSLMHFDSKTDSIYTASKDINDYIYFDKKLKEIASDKEDFLPINGMTVYREDEKWRIKNEKGKIIPTKNLQYINRFINYNLAIGQDINGKFGLINRRGSTVLPFEYSNIYVNADASFTVFKNAFNGRVDEFGHIIFPAVYTNLRPVIDQNGQFKKLYIGQINNKYLLLDDKNKLIFPELKGNFSQVKQFFRNQKEVYLFSEIKPLEEGEEKNERKMKNILQG